MRHLPCVSQAIRTWAIITTGGKLPLLPAGDVECELSTTPVSGWVEHSNKETSSQFGPNVEWLIPAHAGGTDRTTTIVHLGARVKMSPSISGKLALCNSVLITGRCYNS